VPKVLRETHPKVAKEMLDLHHKVDKEPKVLRVIEDHKVVREIVVQDLQDLRVILLRVHRVHKEMPIQDQQDLRVILDQLDLRVLRAQRHLKV
jgi:hypothetical protein